MEIDLNADLGEGAGSDAELMRLVTSANVCCGAHAGGPDETAAALELAQMHGVAVGAHPGYADRANFGRRDLVISTFELTPSLVYQIGGAVALGRVYRAPVRYIKAHGALYHRLCVDPDIAEGFACDCEPFGLPIVGLPHSELHEFTLRNGLSFIAEGFADRRYRPDGSLVPRTDPGAFVHDPDEAVAQVEWLVRAKGVRTVCVHGDNPRAVAFATAVRAALLARGFTLQPFA